MSSPNATAPCGEPGTAPVDPDERSSWNTISTAKDQPPQLAECREAEVVRRDWLRQFLTRKTPPQGAEVLICEAVVGGQFTLTKAMDAAHPTLRDLLGLDTASVYGGGRQAAERLADQQTTPKAATMTTLAAVVTAWEASTGKHTWRNPNSWDARVLGALAKWGYQPSEVESLLLARTSTDNQPTDDQPVAV